MAFHVYCSSTSLLLSGTAMSAPVRIAKAFHLIKEKFRLVLHNAELADSVIDMNLCIAHRIDRHKPLVIVSAVGTVDNALMIGLNNAKILKRGTARHDMRFIAFRKFHRHTERNQFELAFLQRDFFCGTQIDPVRFAVNICQFFYFIRKIFDFDRFCFHIHFTAVPSPPQIIFTIRPLQTYIFSADKPEGGIVTGKEQRIEELNRNSVSNKTSAVINQITGILVGIILIFLALHISFQDNTRDILILNMLGHPAKHIRKLLIDIYLPVLWVMFLISLAPSMILARAIQKSLSVSTGDYMPFGINLLVIIIAFGLINAIYYGIRTIFHFRMKKMIKNEKIADIIYAE